MNNVIPFDIHRKKSLAVKDRPSPTNVNEQETTSLTALTNGDMKSPNAVKLYRRGLVSNRNLICDPFLKTAWLAFLSNGLEFHVKFLELVKDREEFELPIFTLEQKKDSSGSDISPYPNTFITTYTSRKGGTETLFASTQLFLFDHIQVKPEIERGEAKEFKLSYRESSPSLILLRHALPILASYGQNMDNILVGTEVENHNTIASVSGSMEDRWVISNHLILGGVEGERELNVVLR